MEINEDQKRKIWDDLVEEGKKEAISRIKLPNEKSIQDFSKETGLTDKVSRRMLEVYVSAGTMTKREAIINGKKTTLYCPK